MAHPQTGRSREVSPLSILFRKGALGFLRNRDELSNFTTHLYAVQRERRQAVSRRMELRSALRYQLAAQVVFKWEGLAGAELRGEGVTRDISVNGAFILTANCPPAGIMLRVEISLPQLYSGGRSIRMVNEGRVVRVERPVLGESRDGFALVGKDFAMPEVARKS